MRTWLKFAILGAVCCALAVLSVTSALQGRHIRTLKETNKRQGVVIDSLLTMDRNKVEIQLFVTDKSVNKIYGRYNKGTIQMPSVKTYVLECDSTQITKK